MTVIERYLGAELPAWAISWPAGDGTFYDFTSGWTFVLKVSGGGTDAALLTKTTGFTGSTGSATDPNLTIAPVPADGFQLLDPGVYQCTVTASNTASGLDAIETFLLRLLPVPT